MFSNFGGRDSFGGEIVTIKCFEDNFFISGTGHTARYRQGHITVVVHAAALQRHDRAGVPRTEAGCTVIQRGDRCC